MTFNEIEQQWQQAETLEQRRVLWEDLGGTSQGWLTACQAAVTGDDLPTIEQWLEAAAKVEAVARRQAPTEPKEACLQFRQGIYAPIARAYLLCAQAMLQTLRSRATAPVPDSALERLAAQMPTLAWPLNQWRDVLHSLHPSGTRVPALHSVTLPVVLVHLAPQQPARGVIARLTLALRPHGTGTFYPALPMAFVQCDEEFRTTAHNVWTYLHTAGVWPPTDDVCWQLTRGDERPLLFIAGSSLGAALALGLAKLFALERRFLCDRLDPLELQYFTLTAACTTEGTLAPVTQLETKMDAARTEPDLHWLVLSRAQPDIEQYLASTSEPLVLSAATLQDAVHSLAEAQRPPNPFRRLQPFDVQHAVYFGGRDEDIAAVLSRVHETRFTALVGISGSGKSSLVFAGVVPQLDPRQWVCARCRPQLATSGALQYAPERLGVGGGGQLGDSLQGAEQHPACQGEKSLAEHVVALLEGAPEKRLLLIIDQFEEVFNGPTEAQRGVFFKHLDLVVGGELPCTILITMRADFLDRMLSRVAEFWQDPMITLRPMKAAQLRQAMEKPVDAVKLRFEAGLASRIVQALQGAPGALIVLEIVLDRLFDKRQGRMLTHKAYEEMGEVQNAVARYADEVIDELAPKEDQPQREQREKQLQEIFGNLVWNDEGTASKATRYVAPLTAIGEHNEALVKALVTKGLLVQAREGVQVAHEALIEHWPLMQEWVQKHGVSLRFHDQFKQWYKNQLAWALFLVPVLAGCGGLLTRPLFAHYLGFGTFLRTPVTATTPTPDSLLAALIHGFFGTWLGSILCINLAVKVFFEPPHALRRHTSALLSIPGVLWGAFLGVLCLNDAPYAALGYTITGPCWGLGVAVGVYASDRWGGPSTNLTQSLGYRCVGAGLGTLCVLLGSLCIMSPVFHSVFPEVVTTQYGMRRAWGEVFEQTVSVWVLFGCLYSYLCILYKRIELSLSKER